MITFESYYGPPQQPWVATGKNLDRANWAEESVIAFRMACAGEMDESAIFDLVANLGHLCDRLSAQYEDFDMDFEVMVDRARRHYEAERGTGDDLEQTDG